MATAYKILGQACPSSTSTYELYMPELTKSAVISSFVITNVSGAAANATIYIRKNSGAASDSNTLIKAAPIATADFKALTLGITLAGGDSVTVQSSVANALTFHVFGSEIA